MEDLGKEFEPPLLVAKGLWVDNDVNLLSYDALRKVCLQDVAVVLRGAVLEQYYKRTNEETTPELFIERLVSS